LYDLKCKFTEVSTSQQENIAIKGAVEEEHPEQDLGKPEM
jgi:hypothetical protein